MISFACDTAFVPEDVVRAVKEQMEDLAEALSRLPRSTPFWSSIEERGLDIAVAGWRFAFRIVADGAVLTRLEASSRSPA